MRNRFISRVHQPKGKHLISHADFQVKLQTLDAVDISVMEGRKRGNSDIVNLPAVYTLICHCSCRGRWFPPHSCQVHRAVSILRGCQHETTQQFLSALLILKQ